MRGIIALIVGLACGTISFCLEQDATVLMLVALVLCNYAAYSLWNNIERRKHHREIKKQFEEQMNELFAEEKIA